MFALNINISGCSIVGACSVLCAAGSDAMYICDVRCNLLSAKFEFKSKSAENMGIKMGGMDSRQWVVADWWKVLDN